MFSQNLPLDLVDHSFTLKVQRELASLRLEGMLWNDGCTSCVAWGNCEHKFCSTSIPPLMVTGVDITLLKSFLESFVLDSFQQK